MWPLTKEEVFGLMRRCEIEKGKELVPGEAYLFKRKFLMKYGAKKCFETHELIVLTKDGDKAGVLYRVGSWNIFLVMKPEYEGQHIMSNFLKTGIIKKIWPEITAVSVYEQQSQEEYDKRKHMAQLCHLPIRDQEWVEELLAYCNTKEKENKQCGND